MGRTLSGTMNSILAGDHEIDWTVTLNFPDATSKHFATDTLTISSVSYTNDLESVSEIRQTLESPVDRVSVAIQNDDRVLGQDVAVNWKNWRNCEAVIGRYYRNAAGTSSEWLEMFRGTVQQPIVDDENKQVNFDIIPDTVAPGPIVTQYNLGLNCPFLFKDAKTCAYAGGLTTCNHHLKSPDGCDGRSNTHHYGGMESRYNPDSTVPGSGGDPTGGGGGGTGGGDDNPPCPRVDQFLLVKGANGKLAATRARQLTSAHWLWNPVKQQFFKVRRVRIERDQPIWKIVATNGACGYSSFSHPVIWYREHFGEPVKNFVEGDPMLTELDGMLEQTAALWSADTGDLADVVRIEIESDDMGEKIYCYGDDPRRMIACHNVKILQ